MAQLATPRPFGIALIVGLFVLFSFVEILLLFLHKDGWWLPGLLLVASLMFLLRGLWRGEDKQRRSGGYYAFVLGAILLLGTYDVAENDLLDVVNQAEGLYLLCAGAYLFSIRNHPFFRKPVHY